MLVVSTKRAAEMTWPAEAKLWRPDLSLSLAAGTKAQRQKALDAGSQITVISRDNLAQAPTGRYKTIILDELSSFKNHTTKRFKSARALTEKAKYVWGLTGTPAPRGYTDLWAQIYLLDAGVRLGPTITSFRRSWFYAAGKLPSGVVTRWLPVPGAVREIDRLLSDIVISMRSEDYLQLPPLVYNEVMFKLPVPARKLYEDMKRDLVAKLKEDTWAAKDRAGAMNKLSQVVAGTLYDPDRLVHTAAVDTVAEVVGQLDEPCLVLYNFKQLRDQLLQAIPDSTLDVAEFIKGRSRVLIAHPASVGHGLNLQRHTRQVIWAGLPWSLELYEQTNARAWRQGQNRRVFIHHVIAADTIDQTILKALQSKQDVQQQLMEALLA